MDIHGHNWTHGPHDYSGLLGTFFFHGFARTSFSGQRQNGHFLATALVIARSKTESKSSLQHKKICSRKYPEAPPMPIIADPCRRMPPITRAPRPDCLVPTACWPAGQMDADCPHWQAGPTGQIWPSGPNAGLCMPTGSWDLISPHAPTFFLAWVGVGDLG